MILQVANPPKTELLNKRYSVVLAPTKYKKKPTNFARIHSELNHAPTVHITLYELLEAVTSGQTWRNGIHLAEDEKPYIEHWQAEYGTSSYDELAQMIEKYHKTKRTERKTLYSTNLAVLDVDDIMSNADPVEVMQETGAIALYYTFSHQRTSSIDTQENRYRLLYDLSDTVHGKEQLAFIQADIKKSILDKYNYLNDKKFKNKSHGIDNITQHFHGTINGYEINPDFKTYEVADLIEAHEKEINFEMSLKQAKKSQAKRTHGIIEYQSATAEQILDVANYLGDLNDRLSFEEWRTLAIGLWNTAQEQGIDDAVIIEALEILNGHEQGKDERYYLDFKRPPRASANNATIGTLFDIAKEQGYKLQVIQPPTPDKRKADNVAEPIMIERYIRTDDFLNLLKNDDERILLVSDTGTGKTHSAIDASRQLNAQDKKSFVYIALPVIPLSEQAEAKYGTNTAIIGTNRVNTRLEVNKAINNDTRLLIGTYNKAVEVANHLKDYNVSIIADEAHKEVSDYNFRYEVIKQLFDITQLENVTKFIAMTGTPSEIDFNHYDKVVPFDLKTPKVLADKLQFVEYTSASDYESITARSIEQEVNQGHKVLAFIDNKKMIKKLAQALRLKGLKVSQVQADIEPKKSKTYQHLLNHEQFADDTEVILTTRLLADGINIQNTKDYVLMIAPNHYKQANFYNIDLIRQASNRFRNQYNKIMVLLYVKDDVYHDSEHPRASDNIYNLEYQYQSLMRTANIIKAQSESEFKHDIGYFTPSIAEHLAGLFRPREADFMDFKRAYNQRQLAEQGLQHDTTILQELERLEDIIFTIDERHIRSQASQDKENYYSLYPNAFRRALIENLNVLEVETMDAHRYFLSNDTSLSQILDEITALETESNKEKRDNLRIILHELIYSKIQQEVFINGNVNESTDEWKLLKDKMNSYQYTALKSIIKFMDYDEAIKELEYVKKQAQTKELVNGFKAITELTKFRLQKPEHETEKVYKILLENIDGQIFHMAKDKDELIKELAKEYKIKRYAIAKRHEIFKATFKRYFVRASAKNQPIRYSHIDFMHLASQRDMPTTEIQKIYRSWHKYSR